MAGDFAEARAVVSASRAAGAEGRGNGCEGAVGFGVHFGFLVCPITVLIGHYFRPVNRQVRGLGRGRIEGGQGTGQAPVASMIAAGQAFGGDRAGYQLALSGSDMLHNLTPSAARIN